MKKILMFLALATITGTVFAQKAQEGRIQYKKTDEPAILITYDYPAAVVDNALKAKMADLQLTGQNSRGFLVYKNSVISAITSSKLDYSFKTQPQGSKTTLYLLMEGSGSISGDAAVLASRAKAFLEDLNGNVVKSNTIFQIKKQEAIMVDEEKKLNTLRENYNALDQKVKAQEKIVASQKSILEDLKAKN
ncbi:MAG: hypothetical protein J7539_11980 [Niabella sp.]|nr:hypothetical protein [Niabella sp.]